MRRLSPLAALVVAGCSVRQNMLAPEGPGARSLAGLGELSLILFSATTMVVCAILGYAALRRRGSLAEHAPFDAGGGEGWLLVGGLIIPAVTFGALFALTLARIDDFPLHDGAHRAPEIRVVGHQWWWEVHYPGDRPDAALVTANELHIPVGQPIEIALESRDVIHSFWVPRLHGKVDLVPGRVNHLRLMADEPGVYLGQCAEFCGVQHANMRLVVVAETREGYARWIAAQARPAAPPADDEARRGATLFATRACGLCHTVRGTGARGSVGPDLTHLASRRGLAANALPNQRAYLAAWIIHAQSLKPGVVMPDVTDFTGPELRALTRYLEGLQ